MVVSNYILVRVKVLDYVKIFFRDGEICLKRWLQMVRYIGEHKERPFIQKVEILAKRYCPEMLEYRAKDDDELK
jgi:hypothetical protein